MSNEDLLKSFQVISELENRKITYEKAISKVEQEIENAGMWYREAEPIQPTQNLNHYWNKHSLRALLLFFILIKRIETPRCKSRCFYLSKIQFLFRYNLYHVM